MIKQIFLFKPVVVLLIFIFADVVCVGMGMGVPFFPILFGFPVGWYLYKRFSITYLELMDVLRRTYCWGMITSGFTFLLMCILWLPWVHVLFKPNYDFGYTGIPMILYEPRISFVGWLILMVIISPFLQFLMTIFGALSTLLLKYRRVVVSC